MRYDRLMALGWKYLIEIAILWVLVSTALVVGQRRGLEPVRRRTGRGRRSRSLAFGVLYLAMPKPGEHGRGVPLMGRLSGFRVTLRQMCKPRLTTEYPKVKRDKPERQHGRHVLNRYEDGMEKCIGCELCAGVCPAKCIYVRGADNPIDDPVSPGERYGFVYEINYLRCIHCDLCVEACPTEAITETKLFEFSFTNRADAIYTKDELLVDDDGRAKRMPWELWIGGEDDHTSAWMRATSPAGAAAYEGRVDWSGELGFGVRPPERASDGRQRPHRRAGPDADGSRRSSSSARSRSSSARSASSSRATRCTRRCSCC